MAKEKKKKVRYYKIPVSEKNWIFLSQLSTQTQHRMFRAIRDYIGQVIDELKSGKRI